MKPHVTNTEQVNGKEKIIALFKLGATIALALLLYLSSFRPVVF